MDLNFYSDLSDGSGQNVDSEFLDTQPYSGYSENKFPGGSEHYLTINGAGHFLSAEQTFHTPSLGDEVFEIPPISLDTVTQCFGELSDVSEGTGGPSGSGSLVSNLVVGANDPSFASTFVNAGAQGLDHLNLGVMSQSSGGALLSSSALEMGGSMASHFRSSSPMTIDVADINNSLLGSSQLTTIDQSELGLGLAGGHILSRAKSNEQPLSATASPAGSLQDDDMDGTLYQSVLVDSPIPLSSSSVLPTMSSGPASLASVPPATARGRGGGGKPATVAPGAGPKKPGRKKKDPNEPVKPVSAYALFFRDTQAAIKGQNPNASFGEVSKIVASMWDSLAEEQKQVYKRKTEMAKKDYLKALAAYRASQLSQPCGGEVADAGPSLPPANTTSSASGLQMGGRLSAYNPDENTITNICASNIILDVPEVTTRSRTGAKPATVPTTSPPPATQTITKIIISNHGGGQVVTVLPSGVRTLQPRQPPPLQQMQSAPPPPRLQQMAPAPPPPLLAKPGGASSSIAATPPPPLQIKIVPSSLQCTDQATPIIVASSTGASGGEVSSSAGDPRSPKAMPAMALQGVKSVESLGNTDDDDMEEEDEELHSEQVQMELNESSDPGVCVRAGCNNPVIDSDDWDKEYCSNECVANHCRDIFMAWCSIRKHSFGKVK